MSKKLRIAFIGAGGISRAHMTQLAKWDDVEIVAASDVSEKSLAEVKEKFGVQKTFGDWPTMLKECDLDAVSVCTPNGLHYQATIDALNAGCHVLVEKPLAMDAIEGQKMIDCAKKNGKELIIAFQHRYSAGAQMLRKAADAGQFGKIMFMKAQALRRRGIPNWGVFGRKDLQGGGPMIDIGVHIMEMSHYVMGQPKPVAATGSIFTYMGDKPSDVASMWPNWDYKTYTVEDLAIGHIRFDNGAVMQVEASFAAHCEDKWCFNFMGELGGGNYDPLKVYRDIDGYMIDATPAFLPKYDIFEKKMRAFVDTALNGAENICPAESGLAIQKMIDAIYKSSELGKEVEIV